MSQNMLGIAVAMHEERMNVWRVLLGRGVRWKCGTGDVGVGMCMLGILALGMWCWGYVCWGCGARDVCVGGVCVGMWYWGHGTGWVRKESELVIDMEVHCRTVIPG